ncbi:MAG: 50S ribosomal protein L13 [Chloroherpetonaceae bacterium]|nr:50S ribosomal protein L13 [Chloroherpetonaceae bacterium]
MKKKDNISFKTYSAKPNEVERKWLLVDAEGQTLGRLSTRVATLLRGKHKPEFTPHIDTGDFVVVINASKVKLTGAKEENKVYFHNTLYPGGGRYEKFADVFNKKPERVIEDAVWGMLPKNNLGRKIYGKLKVYANADHPHTAQSPAPVTLG